MRVHRVIAVQALLYLGLLSGGELQAVEKQQFADSIHARPQPFSVDQSQSRHKGRHAGQSKNFNRIATFPICSQISSSCNTDTATAAEIVAASEDGMTLIYTDSPQGVVGFVDITQPAQPMPLGQLALGGEPTSVAVKGPYALVAVNTSEDFINTSGHVAIIDIHAQKIVQVSALGGQPDAISVSPDGQYAAIAIENERNEDLDDGYPPQLPAGNLVVMNIAGENVSEWSLSSIDLSGVAERYSADPEPEFVDINRKNIAVVSLQENNHIVLVDLAKRRIVEDFSAGDVDLYNVDLTEGALIIDQTESIDNVLREPDGVAWINQKYFVTADEGDLDGGSRGFSIFDRKGNVVWHSGNTLDQLSARFGHYPDERSANKGNEPENVEVGIFGKDRLLFVNSERSSLVFVYDVSNPRKPKFKQVLPTAAAPEGGLAIPARNLLIVASEEDSRSDKLRSALNIYRYSRSKKSYPTLASVDRDNGTPIPWGALSGLSADPADPQTLYAVEDSFYNGNRIFTIAFKKDKASLIHEEIRIRDSKGVFAGIDTIPLNDPSVADDHPTRVNVFDEADLSAMINDDLTVNIDPEGIAKAEDGGYWLASEGSGTVGDSSRPINSLNFIFKLDEQGVIENVITLPPEVNSMQLRFGFEGLAQWDNTIYVAFQRAWGDEAYPRIGLYNIQEKSWRFVYYPLDDVISNNGGWVGLSDLSALGKGEFLVLERDNQAGPDAAVKRLYRINVSPTTDGLVNKTLVRNLIPDLAEPAGYIYEKVEGVAVNTDGEVFIVNDNDGVSDNSGETQLIQLNIRVGYQH